MLFLPTSWLQLWEDQGSPLVLAKAGKGFQGQGKREGPGSLWEKGRKAPRDSSTLFPLQAQLTHKDKSKGVLGSLQLLPGSRRREAKGPTPEERLGPAHTRWGQRLLGICEISPVKLISNL